MDYSKRLHSLIPGGAHTYSRGDDQFPENAPPLLMRGKGAYVWGPGDDKYLDYGMGLRSVNIGYADETVNNAVISAINLGNNLTRASYLELQAAEIFIETIDYADMVKFAKNGSNVTTAAIKLSRAYTNKTKILRCRQHPFFSFDDWFIVSSQMKKGVPLNYEKDTLLFDYNNIEQVEQIVRDIGNEIACIILEPATDVCPKVSELDVDCCGMNSCTRIMNGQNDPNFLHKLRKICDRNNIILIFDEMITGFRWHISGAQKMYGVKPDLSTFGKAMANGFSLAALAGRRDIMKLGGIDEIGMERLFLLSSTHGAEMSSLAAFISTVESIDERSIIPHLWNYGSRFVSMFNQISKNENMEQHIFAKGPVVAPIYVTLDQNFQNSMLLRTIFNQEMIRQKVLMPWLSFSFSHGDKELQITGEALQKAIRSCKMLLEQGLESKWVNKVQKPVFRKYN